MSDALDPDIGALIAAAQKEFARGLVAKTAAVAAFVASGAWSDAQRAAHKLRGSAGVYGFSALGAIMSEVDDLLQTRAGGPDATTRQHIVERVAAAQSEAERASKEQA